MGFRLISTKFLSLSGERFRFWVERERERERMDRYVNEVRERERKGRDIIIIVCAEDSVSVSRWVG